MDVGLTSIRPQGVESMTNRCRFEGLCYLETEILQKHLPFQYLCQLTKWQNLYLDIENKINNKHAPHISRIRVWLTHIKGGILVVTDNCCCIKNQVDWLFHVCRMSYCTVRPLILPTICAFLSLLLVWYQSMFYRFYCYPYRPSRVTRIHSKVFAVLVIGQENQNDWVWICLIKQHATQEIVAQFAFCYVLF